MSQATDAGQRVQKERGDVQAGPPMVLDRRGRVHQIDPSMPLHRLAVKRVRGGRDLKIIVTAENSETGVGKTTAAAWLALSWNKMFTGRDWFCDPEEPTDGLATLDPDEYWEIIAKVGSEFAAGTTVLVDDAEELDARRSMQETNVEFSHNWMLMRLKQAITIVTLPSPSAIDSRLEELADIWINIEARGIGLIHDLRVENYGSRNVLTKQEHRMHFPDVSEHPELNNLRKMKENKMSAWENPSESNDEGESESVELPIKRQIEFAKIIRDDTGASWKRLGDADHPLTEDLSYSGEYIRQKKKELEPANA